MRKIIATTLLVLLLLSFFNWKKHDYFQIIFFDVGQGDSALIITPSNKTILIDGGPDLKALRQIDSILPFWKRSIDLLILSHAHDDHFLGLIPIAERFKIRKIIYGQNNNKSPSFKTWQKAFIKNEAQKIFVQDSIVFNFSSNCRLEVINLSDSFEDDENNYSLIEIFSCLDKVVLLSGDAGLNIENKMIKNFKNLKVDIFKISHHGSDTANSLPFLETINPEIVVISVGVDNKFNHPKKIIIDRLKKMPVDIYRTDKNGLLYFLANNRYIKIIK